MEAESESEMNCLFKGHSVPSARSNSKYNCKNINIAMVVFAPVSLLVFRCYQELYFLHTLPGFLQTCSMHLWSLISSNISIADSYIVVDLTIIVTLSFWDYIAFAKILYYFAFLCAFQLQWPLQYTLGPRHFKDLQWNDNRLFGLILTYF